MSKIALISATDTLGGAARATYRLHKGLLEAGVESEILCQKKFSADPHTYAPTSRSDKILAQLSGTIDQLPVRRYKNKIPARFSPAWSPGKTIKRIKERKPDIVHLHWLGDGILRIEAIQKLPQPVVWTMHDMWPFTGGCHYSSGCTRYRHACGTCGVLGSTKKSDLSVRTLSRKKRSWNNLEMTIVSPSRWLAACASQSALFQHLPIHVIPNGLDTDVYRPVDQHIARSLLKLPLEANLVMFGALGGDRDPRKGGGHLQKALSALTSDSSTPVELVMFGGRKSVAFEQLDCTIHHFDALHDDISLALLYSAADVFVAPSEEDNLPNTVMESLACGTPCVTFNIGGMPDMIEHQINGYLAQPFEPTDLAMGIKWMLADKLRLDTLGTNARTRALTEFSYRTQAARYKELYEHILA
ncbi:glycosyltransferase family 4 protein [Immundisolibacter sp.]|uniref:glycosyltransferase family 4 protein n=1 Tax=Immundisolibacter sp. TaxID=1934948 RepID=UPI003F82F859